MLGHRAGIAATLTITLIAFCGGPARAATAEASTRYVELDPLVRGDSYPSAMSGRGDIAGTSMRAGELRPVLWRAGQTAPVQLRHRGHPPTAVSDTGDVVFSALEIDPLDRGFRWRDGRLTPLSRPPWQVWPAAVNERRQVAGVLWSPPPVVSVAFVWQNGRFTELPAPTGWLGRAIGINNHGHVLGQISATDGSSTHAVVWRDGRMVELGSLGGPYTDPTAINDRGQVIGQSSLGPTGPVHPFQWQNGVMRDLLSGTGSDVGAANAMNAAGDVVGYIDLRPVVWRAGVPSFLPGPGPNGNALAINDRGQIAGWVWGGELGDTASYLFRWDNGAMTLLDRPAGVTDLAVFGIDDRGRLAVHYVRADGRRAIARTDP